MKKVKIVSAAWLEDSLVTCHRRPKPEGEYLLVGTRKGGRGKRSAKEKKADTKTAESPEKNVSRKKNTTRVQDIIAEMATRKLKVPGGYQLYKDEVNFTYDVKLVRPSQHSNRKERYSMMLFESTTPTTDLDPPTPKTYSTFIAFTAPGKSGEHHLAPPGSPWPLASKSFRNFFKQKTGKMWEERGDGKVPEPKRGVGGEVLPVDEGWFRYEVLVGATAAGEGSGKVVNLVEERDAERDAGGDGGGGADAGEGCGKVVNLVEERDGEGVEQGGVSEGGERGVATVGDSQVKEKVV
ncbi:hypothetical protein FQN54_009016 [Arachnomyces sp. PD_36]|nr:hypothetical protein FQN54_009016 [Arachnomyces sp. PD_36]